MIEVLKLQPARSELMGNERLYYKRKVILEVGGFGLGFEAIVNMFFGTDSIIDDQKNRSFSDAMKALEIITNDESDIRRLCYDLNYASAFRLLRDEGPITGFSELITSQPLTSEQVAIVEGAMMSEQVLIDLYGIKGRIRSFDRRRKGLKVSALQMSCVGKSKSFGTVEASGKYLPSNPDDRNTVLPVYEVDLNYLYQKLTFCRHWLTGVAKKAPALAFINQWESVSPEARLADFISQLTVLSSAFIRGFQLPPGLVK